jgi:hypothetical protein
MASAAWLPRSWPSSVESLLNGRLIGQALAEADAGTLERARRQTSKEGNPMPHMSHAELGRLMPSKAAAALARRKCKGGRPRRGSPWHPSVVQRVLRRPDPAQTKEAADVCA